MRIRTVAAGILLLLTAVALAAGQNGNDLYQQGLARETAGDLKGAIQIFERIVREYPANRVLSARALLQLGRWSDLLGEDQARKHYERVIREFADQKEAAAEARTRLDALAKVPAPAASPARRMAINWRVVGAVTDRTKVMRDGRHRIRYNEEPRAFEMVDIVTGGVRRLTTDGPSPEKTVVLRSQELSNDGRKIAAVIQILRAPAPVPALRDIERTELRVFEIGGRGPGRVLVTWDQEALGGGFLPFAWSPGDDRIWLFGTRRDQSAQIASVNMSGKLEVLKSLTWRDSGQLPSLSPDGRFIAYHDAAGRQTPSDLHFIATDGSREHRVEDPADDTRPVFLPDGSGVVFVSNRRGERDLWFVDVAEGRPTGQPRVVWRDFQPFGQLETFSDTGNLFFQVSGTDWGTYTMPIDLASATGPMGPPTRLPEVNNELNSAADYSPDGRYLSHFRGGRLVLRELSTGLEREIPLGTPLANGAGGRIDWCPSGDTLLASGYVTGGGLTAFRVNAREGSVQRLAFSPTNGNFPMLCLGDGQEIVYPAFKGNPWVVPAAIIRRSLASGRETVLHKEALAPVVRSMDGSRLAFVAIESRYTEKTPVTAAEAIRTKLVTMSTHGGDVSADVLPRDLKRMVNAQIQTAVWMPGGDRLLISVREAPDVYDWTRMGYAPFTLWDVPLTGAAPRRLGPFQLRSFEGTFFGAGNLSVHPDGKHLTYQAHEGTLQQTWVIDNLFQFIKAGNK